MTEDISFHFETKTVRLNSGYEMPIYGIGTYSLTGEVCVDSVTAALDSGVRLIDTAYMYHNEESVGEAVRNSGIPREEIFVITKMYPNQFSDPEAAIEEALTKLDIDYIDMMLLHHPGEGMWSPILLWRRRCGTEKYVLSDCQTGTLKNWKNFYHR